MNLMRACEIVAAGRRPEMERTEVGLRLGTVTDPEGAALTIGAQPSWRRVAVAVWSTTVGVDPGKGSPELREPTAAQPAFG
jgi:hypothetical protein